MTKYLITGSFELVLDTIEIDESDDMAVVAKEFFNYMIDNFSDVAVNESALKLFVLQYFYWFTERRLDNVKWREIE